MNTALTIPQQLPSRSLLRLSGVDWRTYSRLLNIFAHQRGIRLTYDHGELEIMSPSFEHDDDSRFSERLVVVLTEELGLPLKHGGSVTMRRRGKQRGIEADNCYWIAHAAQMAGVRRLDLRRHPPPDLAIEVDVTHCSLDRLSIYATLRVPEVWRLDGDLLTFYVLQASGKAYTSEPRSYSFPLVAPADLLPFLQQARTAGDENVVARSFRTWIRQRLAASGSGLPTP